MKDLYKQLELSRADLEVSKSSEKEKEKVRYYGLIWYEVKFVVISQISTSLDLFFYQEVTRLKDEVHKHHELSEKLRRDKEAAQADFQKHKAKVEGQVKVGYSLPFFFFLRLQYHRGINIFSITCFSLFENF